MLTRPDTIADLLGMASVLAVLALIAMVLVGGAIAASRVVVRAVIRATVKVARRGR